MDEYKLIVTNSYGESIDLFNDKEAVLTSLEGVSLEADVNTMNLSGLDGSSFVSSRLPERNISIVIQYRNEVIDAEKSKLRIYRIFRPKEIVKIRFISQNQDRYVEGYVTKCDTPPTTFPMVSQVSVKVPDPYWHTFENYRTLLCGVSPSFEFIKDNTELNCVEFSVTKNSLLTGIDYEGDSTVGFTVVFEIKAPVAVIGIRSINSDTALRVKADFYEGDVITICTIPKHKEVTLLRNSERFDYLIKMTPGSRFPMLYPGENVIEVLLEGGTSASVNVNCLYETLFGGI